MWNEGSGLQNGNSKESVGTRPNGDSFLVIPKGYLMDITIKKEGYPAKTLRVFQFGLCSLVNHDGQLRLRFKKNVHV